MTENWNDKVPIYWQIRDRLVTMIQSGIISEGAELPSVREISIQWKINPLTVLKALQIMVQDGLVTKQRGRNFCVAQGIVEGLNDMERQQFLEQEWPKIVKKIERLGLNYLLSSTSTIVESQNE